MKKTLVFLHPNFLKPGGASKVVLEQASRLQEKGYYCPIITTKVNNKIISEYPSLRIYSLSQFSTGQLIFWFTFPIFFIKMVRLLHYLKPDYIYAHSLSIYWGYLIKKISKKTILIIYFHDIGFPYFDSVIESNSLGTFYSTIIKFLRPIFIKLNTNIAKITNYMVANSETTYHFIKNRYFRNADIIVTPGVNLDTFSISKKKKKYIITVGRLELIKNIETVISAFYIYSKLHDNTLKLYVVGEGPLKKRFQKIVNDLKINNKIIFLNYKNHSELAKLFSKAQLGIFMSPNESFGLTAIECLASGTPIIGVNKNGIKEITSHFDKTYLVDNNPNSLADKLKLSLQSSSHEKNSKKARDSVLMYSWESQINVLFSWLKKI